MHHAFSVPNSGSGRSNSANRPPNARQAIGVPVGLRPRRDRQSEPGQSHHANGSQLRVGYSGSEPRWPLPLMMTDRVERTLLGVVPMGTEGDGPAIHLIHKHIDDARVGMEPEKTLVRVAHEARLQLVTRREAPRSSRAPG
jgi:hypothetical protein